MNVLDNKNRKTILVTGGAGFIGSALIAELQRLEYEIFVIDNLSFGSRNFIEIPDERFYKLDILDETEIFITVQEINPDWIIHLAAVHFIPYCNQHPFESANINIQGTINILNAAKKLDKLEKIFFASTAAVYPNCDRAIPETQQTQPMDIYGLSKLAGEHLMHEFYLQTSIPTIVGRFFNAFGPNETNPHLIPEIQKQINSGMRTINLGNLEPKRDFIHTYDMAKAVTLLLDKFERGIDTFNLGSGREYSVIDVVKAFERQIGEDIKIQVDPSRVRKIERKHLLADISKLCAFINWEPKISLDSGIETLVKI